MVKQTWRESVHVGEGPPGATQSIVLWSSTPRTLAKPGRGARGEAIGGDARPGSEVPILLKGHRAGPPWLVEMAVVPYSYSYGSTSYSTWSC
jgi:hypothetical protein